MRRGRERFAGIGLELADVLIPRKIYSRGKFGDPYFVSGEAYFI
jgi:hypothetical protein